MHSASPETIPRQMPRAPRRDRLGAPCTVQHHGCECPRPLPFALRPCPHTKRLRAGARHRKTPREVKKRLTTVQKRNPCTRGQAPTNSKRSSSVDTCTCSRARRATCTADRFVVSLLLLPTCFVCQGRTKLSNSINVVNQAVDFLF